MQKITPFLWYAKEAEEAAAFYASIFPDSHVTGVPRCRLTRPVVPLVPSRSSNSCFAGSNSSR